MTLRRTDDGSRLTDDARPSASSNSGYYWLIHDSRFPRLVFSMSALVSSMQKTRTGAVIVDVFDEYLGSSCSQSRYDFALMI